MSVPSSFDTPVLGPVIQIKDSWIDFKGHLDQTAYAEIFDQTVQDGLDILNAGEAYTRDTGRTFGTAQVHTSHVRQIRRGAAVRATFRLLDADERSLHIYLELFHADGWLAAASEKLLVHVELDGTNAVPFDGELARDIATMLRYHRSLPPTKYMGRRIGIGL